MQISKPIIIVCLLLQGGYHYSQALIPNIAKVDKSKTQGPTEIGADSNVKLIISLVILRTYMVTKDLTSSNPVLVWLWLVMDSFSLVNYLGPVDVDNVEAINVIEDGKNQLYFLD